MADNVNHPSHYTDGKYETIEFIERNLFDYHDGNAIKYVSRAGKKDPNKMIEDLEKALWYINRANHKLDYDEDAITVHDYILDKKLSPELASVIALIEAGEHEEAAKMLDATIKDLKKKEKTNFCGKEFNIGTRYSCNNDFDSLIDAVKRNRFVELPYFEKVVCVYSDHPLDFIVGKVYSTHGDRIMMNHMVPLIFKSPFYSVDELVEKCWTEYKRSVRFVEFKGEA